MQAAGFPAAARLPLVDLDPGAGPDGWNPEHPVSRGPWTLGFCTDVTRSGWVARGLGGAHTHDNHLGRFLEPVSGLPPRTLRLLPNKNHATVSGFGFRGLEGLEGFYRV